MHKSTPQIFRPALLLALLLPVFAFFCPTNGMHQTMHGVQKSVMMDAHPHEQMPDPCCSAGMHHDALCKNQEVSNPILIKTQLEKPKLSLKGLTNDTRFSTPYQLSSPIRHTPPISLATNSLVKQKTLLLN